MTTPFARLELLLGPEALPRLSAARVIIAGLGAVGAAAAESLARSAIGHLTLVDFDEFRASNINRHPFAFHSTLGISKVDTAARSLRDINPSAVITPLALFLDATTSPPLFADHPCDVLIDAIDSLQPKTDLLLAARSAGIPYILTCLGAARKTDPTRFVVADLADSHTCPLARLLRKRLAHHGGTADIRAIFSTEPPLDPTDIMESSAGPTDEFYSRGRRRSPMGSLHACTAVVGLLAARETLRFLLETPCA